MLDGFDGFIYTWTSGCGSDKAMAEDLITRASTPAFCYRTRLEEELEEKLWDDGDIKRAMDTAESGEEVLLVVDFSSLQAPKADFFTAPDVLNDETRQHTLEHYVFGKRDQKSPEPYRFFVLSPLRKWYENILFKPNYSPMELNRRKDIINETYPANMCGVWQIDDKTATMIAKIYWCQEGELNENT